MKKAHKLVDYAGRCIDIPNDPAAAKFYVEDCVRKIRIQCRIKAGRARGPAPYTLKSGDKMNNPWEESGHLKEYTYKNTGGTGKYEGASGGGTYTLEELTDTLMGGTYKGALYSCAKCHSPTSAVGTKQTCSMR